MTSCLPMIRPARVRLYLLLLQGMFLLLYGFHLASPISRAEALLSASLATITLLILTIPRVHVEATWFIGLVTLINASLLFLTFGATTDLWVFGAVLLLLAMASYVPSMLDFSALSALLIGEYGLVLYRTTGLENDAIFTLPLLLSVTLVFVSKITTAQAEIQRIVKTDEHPQNRIACDVLTGLPNRAQFLERLGRVIQSWTITRRFGLPSCLWILMASSPSMTDSGTRRVMPCCVTSHASFKAVCDKGTSWGAMEVTNLSSS